MSRRASNWLRYAGADCAKVVKAKIDAASWVVRNIFRFKYSKQNN